MRLTSDRRRFLSWVNGALATTLGLTLAVPVLGYLLAPIFRPKKRTSESWVELLPLAAVPGGQPMEVSYLSKIRDGWITRTEARRAIIVRGGPEELVVFSATCPHLNCGVHWEQAKGQFSCPCHGGVFDREGKVIAGPPARGLLRLPVKIEQGKVWIQEA